MGRAPKNPPAVVVGFPVCGPITRRPFDAEDVRSRQADLEGRPGTKRKKKGG